MVGYDKFLGAFPRHLLESSYFPAVCTVSNRRPYFIRLASNISSPISYSISAFRVPIAGEKQVDLLGTHVVIFLYSKGVHFSALYQSTR